MEIEVFFTVHICVFSGILQGPKAVFFGLTELVELAIFLVFE